jgi:hypothetical protein
LPIDRIEAAQRVAKYQISPRKTLQALVIMLNCG